MAKNENKKGMVWIVILLLAALLLFGKGFMFESNNRIQITSEEDSRVGNLPPQGVPASDDYFMRVRLFDANNKELPVKYGRPETFSIIPTEEGLKSVTTMIVDTKVTNIGNVALSCIPTTLTPALFNGNVTKSLRYVLPSSSTVWTSNVMLTSAFEGPAPNYVIFNATVVCNYTIGSVNTVLPAKSGFLNISITPDSTGNFIVNVTLGGTPTAFCGDATCNNASSPTDIGENISNCPADCYTPSGVKYRTTDITYASGGAIAYSSSCGTVLTAYGFSAGSGNLGGSCVASMPSNQYCGSGTNTLLESSIPGTWVSGGSGASLYQSASPNTLCVCDDNGAGSYQIKKYTTGDSDASKVSTLQTAQDPTKELTC